MDLNLRELSLTNSNFKNIIEKSSNMTLAVMNVEKDIGEEEHNADQFIYIINGQAKVIMNGNEKIINNNEYVIIPSGTKHNVINLSEFPLKLFTLYCGCPVATEDATLSEEPPADETQSLASDVRDVQETKSNKYVYNGVEYDMSQMAGGKNYKHLKNDYLKLKSL